MKKYNFLNVVRLVMALIVVSNHLHPLDVFIEKNIYLKNLYDFIIPFAVPFFFITTGFFLGKKLKSSIEFKDDDKEILKKYLINDLKLYIFFSILYLPLTIYGFWYEKQNFFLSILMFFRGLLLVGENYNSWILWYLLSEIYFFCFTYFFSDKIKKFKNFFAIGICLYLMGIAINIFNSYDFVDSYLVIAQKICKCVIPNGRIFYSILYISSGIIISNSKHNYNKLLCIISLLCLVFLNTFIVNEIFNKISLFLCSIINFYIIINCEFKNSKFADFCKLLSKNMYFYHLIVWSILAIIIDGYIHCNYGILYYVLTVVIIVIVTCLKKYLAKSKNN